MAMSPPQNPEPTVLGYRPRAANPAARVGPREWLNVSLTLGMLSWGTVILLCAGGTARWAWLPAGLAGVGLLTGAIAAAHPLPRDATPGVFGAIFMSFFLIATWLLALVLL